MSGRRYSVVGCSQPAHRSAAPIHPKRAFGLPSFGWLAPTAEGEFLLEGLIRPLIRIVPGEVAAAPDELLPGGGGPGGSQAFQGLGLEDGIGHRCAGHTKNVKLL